MSAQYADEKKTGVSRHDALQMLQAALKECMAAGLTVRAGNVTGVGLVVAVQAAYLDGGRLQLVQAEPVTVPEPA